MQILTKAYFLFQNQQLTSLTTWQTMTIWERDKKTYHLLQHFMWHDQPINSIDIYHNQYKSTLSDTCPYLPQSLLRRICSVPPSFKGTRKRTRNEEDTEQERTKHVKKAIWEQTSQMAAIFQEDRLCKKLSYLPQTILFIYTQVLDLVFLLQLAQGI